MKKSLQALKSAFSSEAENSNSNTPSNYYPFWNIKDGERAVIRFLPDLNENNPYGFLVQKLTHTLTINGETKTVPCLTMYGEECPICKLSQKYYKAEGKESANGKKYWRKKQHLAQALVIEDPLPPNDAGENHEGKLRFITLGFQLYEIIQNAFKSDDVLDEIPYDYNGGYDFIIKKSRQGEYSTYTIGSMFARKQRSLTDEELAVVEEHLVDLSALLPKNPGYEKVEAMLQASLVGAEYNDEDEVQMPTRLTPPVASKKPTISKPSPVVVDEEEKEEEEEVVVVPPKKQVKAAPKQEEQTDDEVDMEAVLADIRNRRRTAPNA